MSTVIHQQNHQLLRHHFPPKPPPPSPPPPQSSSLSLPKPKSRHRPLLLSSTTSLPRYTPPKPFIFNDVNSLLSLLNLSLQYSDADLAKVVHACSLKFPEDTHLGNSLVLAYLKLGLVNHAFKVFNSISFTNVVTYSSLISACAKSNQGNKAIKLFMKMRNEGIEPNEFTFVSVLSACIRVLELELGFQVHSLVIKMGFLDNVYVVNALMGLYGKCNGGLGLVLNMFEELPQRDVASWNTVISSLVKEGMYEKAFEFFRLMQEIGPFRADYFTISAILSACKGSIDLMKGKEAHAHAIRVGLGGNLSVNNALIAFYTNCGSVSDVVTLFESMPVRDVITWTEMITAYMEFGLVDLAMEVFSKMPEKNCVSYNALMAGFCRNGEGLKAVKLFIQMVEEGLELTDFSLSSVINACALVMDAKSSEQIQGFCVKFGFGSNVCVEAALLDMCMRCGRIADAEKMFNMWPSEQDSSVVCTSMFCGYARNGQPDEAISFLLRGKAKANDLFSGAIHLLSAGSSDYIQNYDINPLLNRIYTPVQFSDIFMRSYATFIQNLHGLGARRIGVTTLPPTGCLPAAITLFGAGRFFESRRACCGTGTLETSLLCNARALGTCSNASAYVFWDGFYPSESANQGDLVKVFANEHKKITLDPEMQSHIENTLYSSHASYKVLFSTGYLDIWEPATLTIKREGYSIKCTGANGLVVTEKFSPSTQIQVTFGDPTEFVIIGSNGVQRTLKADRS
ncbi:hypothetical protein CCACVL1_12127 [Corchorus capsularis]|uniref:DUF7046 domain-containing protein n=1 Tax=Corchorus capsularis TaxID=210143 RepID=A0A1R3IH85_COCAP|nr:hypothetical protein CCACVL1_12127 [Corchorus capsularis]